MFKAETDNNLVRIAWMCKDGGLHTGEKQCDSPEAVKRFILSNASSLLQDLICYYVGHKWHLGNTARYKNELAWQQALGRCREFKKWLFNGWNHSMEEIAKYSLRMVPMMEKCLPFPTNPSYERSQAHIKQITEVAQYILDQLK